MALGTSTIRLLILAAILQPVASLAQSTPPQQGQAGEPRNFDAAKQHRLEEIARHIAELRKAEACVQNATELQQMQACRPHSRER